MEWREDQRLNEAEETFLKFSFEEGDKQNIFFFHVNWFLKKIFQTYKKYKTITNLLSTLNKNFQIHL